MLLQHLLVLSLLQISRRGSACHSKKCGHLVVLRGLFVGQLGSTSIALKGRRHQSGLQHWQGKCRVSDRLKQCQMQDVHGAHKLACLTRMCTCMYALYNSIICIYVCIYVCIYIYVCVYVYMYVCVFICVHVYMCVYIYSTVKSV